ncbi:hypothetical protein GOP47_0009381 [Adiantum capillus-veneris]|uniref:Uncharacterized protein n=1 Tax=Adiantum capillus-veneris TaxID=13818 RepID=A0A9D4UWX1_ADICA|nr:hypothetical protein GOP47_0009381 [Adiantum capillus-veneris]
MLAEVPTVLVGGGCGIGMSALHAAVADACDGGCCHQRTTALSALHAAVADACDRGSHHQMTTALRVVLFPSKEVTRVADSPLGWIIMNQCLKELKV